MLVHPHPIFYQIQITSFIESMSPEDFLTLSLFKTSTYSYNFLISLLVQL
jgi:hypothetical protein